MTAKVADKDGNPLGDQNVILMPESAGSQAQFAASLVWGQTDQNGIYQSGTLRPGKYLVLATGMTVDRTPQMIGKLAGMRNRAKEIEISPGGSAQVSLTMNGGEQ
jgi:hypothetical protein